MTTTKTCVPISGALLSLLRFMRERGPGIYRHPGGVWSREHWDGSPGYGTSAVATLVEIGLARWSAHRTIAGGGELPIEAQLTREGREHEIGPDPHQARRAS